MRRFLLLLVPFVGLLAGLTFPRRSSAQEPAVAALAAADKAAPRNAQAALALGRALRRAGRFDEALRALGRAAGNAAAPALADEARYEIARVFFDQPGMSGVYHKAHT